MGIERGEKEGGAGESRMGLGEGVQEVKKKKAHCLEAVGLWG